MEIWKIWKLQKHSLKLAGLLQYKTCILILSLFQMPKCER